VPTLATINRIDSLLSGAQGKWVLVNIWATWCRPCVAETPDLVALHQSLQGKPFLPIGLSTDLMTSPSGPDAIAKVDKFRQSQRVGYPMYIYDGSTDDLVARFKLSGAIPTSILYNPQGQEVERWVGALGADDLARIRSTIS
jgi:thiol-disulfide isomerase/thioredoxin